MPNETKAEKFTAAFIELVKEDREMTPLGCRRHNGVKHPKV
jgi:hypothetical protein